MCSATGGKNGRRPGGIEMVYYSDLLESNQVIITSEFMGRCEHKFNISVSCSLSKNIQEEIVIACAEAIARVLANSVTVQNNYGSFSITPEG